MALIQRGNPGLMAAPPAHHLLSCMHTTLNTLQQVWICQYVSRLVGISLIQIREDKENSLQLLDNVAG